MGLRWRTGLGQRAGGSSSAAIHFVTNEEYAIVTVHPPPQQQHLYDAMEEVVEYFEEVHRVRVQSSCLSPLGLCLIQFSSPIARQAMINLRPHQLDAMREIVVEEHDRGIKLRNCPFTRTC